MKTERHEVFFDQGANGIIVVDLASGESWRRLHDHPSTKAELPPSFLPIVEGRSFMERQPDGKTKPLKIGADGVAISADGSRLYYCLLASRRYSVATDALVDRSLDDNAIAATVTDEGDKGGGADGLESDAAGYIYATNYTLRQTSCTVRQSTKKAKTCAKSLIRFSASALRLNQFCCASFATGTRSPFAI